MIDPSQVVSIHPYFKVKSGRLPEAKALLAEFIQKTSTEKGNLYYDFTINDDIIFCREAYVGAQGLLDHLENVGPVLAQFLTLADVQRVEIHGPAAELALLKEPFTALNPQYFEFHSGVPR